LLARQFSSLDSLPRGAKVGTGSLRRKSHLLHARPDLVIEDIRGNVETRVRKLDEGAYDAIVLAEAGLKRLGLANRITQVLPRELMLPAVGQGALAIETRTDDETTRRLLAPLDHDATHQAVLAERTMLLALCAGCLAPVGALAVVQGERLSLQAAVLTPDGRRRIHAGAATATNEAVYLGQIIAEELLAAGAAEMIAAAHGGSR
jgi:hydroxymethylbilane synthase